MTTNGGSELVFHSLHKQFLQLAQHAYETLKKQKNDAYSLRMIARWGERDVQLFIIIIDTDRFEKLFGQGLHISGYLFVL